MELAVYNSKGEDTGKKVNLSDSIFAVEPNDHAIYLDVKRYLAHQRQGTHKAKERAEITGSTKKIKRQKGTGTARAGSRKSPLFKGGGRAFGPRVRDYSIKLNKKVKQLARKSALSYKAKDNGIVVVEDFSLQAPKTKELVQILTNLKSSEKKSLLVLNEQNKNIYLSSRNLEGIKVLTASEINTYDVMQASKIVLFESTIEVLDKTFSN